MTRTVGRVVVEELGTQLREYIRALLGWRQSTGASHAERSHQPGICNPSNHCCQRVIHRRRPHQAKWPYHAVLASSNHRKYTEPIVFHAEMFQHEQVSIGRNVVSVVRIISWCEHILQRQLITYLSESQKLVTNNVKCTYIVVDAYGHDNG